MNIVKLQDIKSKHRNPETSSSDKGGYWHGMEW